jgi:hypothetical protein
MVTILSLVMTRIFLVLLDQHGKKLRLQPFTSKRLQEKSSQSKPSWSLWRTC